MEIERSGISCREGQNPPRVEGEGKKRTRGGGRSGRRRSDDLFCYLFNVTFNICDYTLRPVVTNSMEQSLSWKASTSSVSLEIPALYGTHRFITEHHPSSLSLAKAIRSMTPNPTSWRCILLLSSYLRPGLPSGSFPHSAPPKPCKRLSRLPYMPHAPPIPFFWIWSLEGDLVKSTNHKVSRYVAISTSLLGPCLPPHPFLEHHQPVFLPQCDRPGFTSIQNNRQNYGSACCNLHTLWQPYGKQILHRTTASTAYKYSPLPYESLGVNNECELPRVSKLHLCVSVWTIHYWCSIFTVEFPLYSESLRFKPPSGEHVFCLFTLDPVAPRIFVILSF